MRRKLQLLYTNAMPTIVEEGGGYFNENFLLQYFHNVSCPYCSTKHRNTINVNFRNFDNNINYLPYVSSFSLLIALAPEPETQKERIILLLYIQRKHIHKTAIKKLHDIRSPLQLWDCGKLSLLGMPANRYYQFFLTDLSKLFPLFSI